MAADNSVLTYLRHTSLPPFLLSSQTTPQTNSNRTVTSRCTVPTGTSSTEQGTKRLRVYWPRPPTTGRARRHIACTYRPRLEIIHRSSSTTSTSHPASTCCTNSTLLSPSKSSASLSSTSPAGSNVGSTSFCAAMMRFSLTARPHRGVRSHYSTAGCLICSESHLSELPYRGVRSHHSMAGCVICSESHMSE